MIIMIKLIKARIALCIIMISTNFLQEKIPHTGNTDPLDNKKSRKKLSLPSQTRAEKILLPY